MDFWLKYESKIVLTIGLALVAVVAFEAGILQGQKWQQKPLVIEKPAECDCQKSELTSDLAPASAAESAQPQPKSKDSVSSPGVQSRTNADKKCAFVGSKNSSKYHLPDCRWAARIKPENLVCFESISQAQEKGYQPCGTCLKSR